MSNLSYVAMVGGAFVEASDSLDDLLRLVRQLAAGVNNEDVVVWHGNQVAAIVFGDDSEIFFEPAA